MTDRASSAPKRLYRPEDMALRPASFPADYRFLYRLLEERYAKANSNIPGMARQELPTFEEHVRYLDSTPFDRIEIVVASGRDVGLMYLTAERVGGCFILDEFAGRGLALAACFTFFSNETYPIIAHFNSRNRAGYKTADRLGWTLVREEPHRLTYELREPPLDPFAGLRGRRTGADGKADLRADP
ncbi:hypothetical protein Poly30_51850 [Planctomycetes bacterium Poly30]|uniref:N-acetyltransferase domain-containing protein n=1 Tax=Saltatorellus ferox TaxID=2528018 RepID=A0A518EZW8_9BACT|nr:hypothetical protein Poly30_51850 [Planctomycetes bacterium Poly30]